MIFNGIGIKFVYRTIQIFKNVLEKLRTNKDKTESFEKFTLYKLKCNDCNIKEN